VNTESGGPFALEFWVLLGQAILILKLSVFVYNVGPFVPFPNAIYITLSLSHSFPPLSLLFSQPFTTFPLVYFNFLAFLKPSTFAIFFSWSKSFLFLS